MEPLLRVHVREHLSVLTCPSLITGICPPFSSEASDISWRTKRVQVRTMAVCSPSL